MLMPAHLVSISHLRELQGVELAPDGSLRIGALARHAEIASSALVQRGWPMLARMAAQLANPQVRNQGTLGGNLCYADPSTDPPACLMALGAQVCIATRDGERRVPMADFVVDYYTTALQEGELLASIVVPALPVDARAHYTRFLRTAAEHRPLANISVVLRTQGGKCTAASIAVGAAVAVPARVARAEDFLLGRTLSAEAVAQAADIIASDINPISDARGDAGYRRDMVRVIARRNLSALSGLTQE